MNKTAASISSIVAKAKASNNGRLNSLALNASEIRVAEKAVARGLLKSYGVEWPGFGYAKMFSIN